ncbi:MAG: hypothetical protein ACRBK7_04980 [Acidimicrobiales bacterium]
MPKKMKQKRAVVIASIVLGGLALTTGIANPASARPKSEWQQVCELGGGTYYNTAWGELCVVNGDYIWWGD